MPTHMNKRSNHCTQTVELTSVECICWIKEGFKERYMSLADLIAILVESKDNIAHFAVSISVRNRREEIVHA